MLTSTESAKKSAASRRVNDNETVLLRQIVPPADVSFEGRPCRSGMDADDQRSGLCPVVTPGNIQEVAARYSRRDNTSIRLITDEAPRQHRRDKRHRKTDDDQQYADNDLSPLALHVCSHFPVVP